VIGYPQPLAKARDWSGTINTTNLGTIVGRHRHGDISATITTLAWRIAIQRNSSMAKLARQQRHGNEREQSTEFWSDTGSELCVPSSSLGGHDMTVTILEQRLWLQRIRGKIGKNIMRSSQRLTPSFLEFSNPGARVWKEKKEGNKRKKKRKDLCLLYGSLSSKGTLTAFR